MQGKANWRLFQNMYLDPLEAVFRLWRYKRDSQSGRVQGIRWLSCSASSYASSSGFLFFPVWGTCFHYNHTIIKNYWDCMRSGDVFCHPSKKQTWRVEHSSSIFLTQKMFVGLNSRHSNTKSEKVRRYCLFPTVIPKTTIFWGDQVGCLGPDLQVNPLGLKPFRHSAIRGAT